MEVLVVWEVCEVLLNTEGILTLPIFLLSDGSIDMKYEVLLLLIGVGYYCLCLLLSIIVKSFKFCFWVFCRRCCGF